MTKAKLWIAFNVIAAGANLWLGLVMPGSMYWVHAVAFVIHSTCAGYCAGYWVALFFDEREETEALRQMVDTLEAAGVYSPEQAAGVRRDLLEQ